MGQGTRSIGRAPARSSRNPLGYLDGIIVPHSDESSPRTSGSRPVPPRADRSARPPLRLDLEVSAQPVSGRRDHRPHRVDGSPLSGGSATTRSTSVRSRAGDYLTPPARTCAPHIRPSQEAGSCCAAATPSAPAGRQRPDVHLLPERARHLRQDPAPSRRGRRPHGFRRADRERKLPRLPGFTREALWGHPLRRSAAARPWPLRSGRRPGRRRPAEGRPAPCRRRGCRPRAGPARACRRSRAA